MGPGAEPWGLSQRLHALAGTSLHGKDDLSCACALSAGIGRTGTFCTIDIILRRLWYALQQPMLPTLEALLAEMDVMTGDLVNANMMFLRHFASIKLRRNQPVDIGQPRAFAIIRLGQRNMPSIMALRRALGSVHPTLAHINAFVGCPCSGQDFEEPAPWDGADSGKTPAAFLVCRPLRQGILTLLHGRLTEASLPAACA